MLTAASNISLIGMPGVGKSTVGVLLAKAAGLGFVDTDVLVQLHSGRGLQEIIDSDGLDAFRVIEERCVLELAVRGHVVATGGSVVYSTPAMEHLKSSGPVVLLDLPIELLERRLDNLNVRGVAMPLGWSLRRLSDQRDAMYRAWADVTVDCTGLTQDQVVAEILASLAGLEKREV